MTSEQVNVFDALAYAEHFSFAVFPCQPRGKKPLTAHGFKDASKDPETIRALWRPMPNANIGIATGAVSGIVVIDVDPRHRGNETLTALEATQGKLPDTPTVLTGGGGLHLYFRHPGTEIRNSAGTLGPGLDVRGDGGYVIAPRSTHESGNQYLWKSGFRLDEIALPELPAWLRERLEGNSPTIKAASCSTPSATVEAGSRNDGLYRLARSLVARYKLSCSELLPSLQALNLERCNPPLDAEEVETIARNAASQPDSPSFKPKQSQARKLILTAASDIHPEEVRWMWPGRIALGKLTLLAGDPGCGKSFLTLDIAARVSTGRGWPDGSAACEPADVIVFSSEDGPADTIRPRLEAAGADLTRVRILTAMTEREGGESSFNLQADLALLEESIRELKPALIIVDPISAYMGDSDSHKNADVRAVLGPVAELAAKYHVTILAISHLGKSENSALYRVLGSIAFIAAARIVHVLARDKADPERRIFATLKNNLAPFSQALAFTIDNTPSIVWEPDAFDMNAAELLAPDFVNRKPGPRADKLEAAKSLIAEFLGDGEEHSARELDDLARERGISPSRMKQARRDLGVQARKDEFEGAWRVRLAKSPSSSSSSNSDSSTNDARKSNVIDIVDTKSPSSENKKNSDSSPRRRFAL
jgi:KaiC/GvpD/RAD55 family RecA-like ATPase